LNDVYNIASQTVCDCGILGNELADTLAKDAATNLDIAEC